MANKKKKQVCQLIGSFLAFGVTAVILYWCRLDLPAGGDVWPPRPAANAARLNNLIKASDARLGDVMKASQVFDTSKLNMEQGCTFLKATYHKDKFKFNAPIQMALLSEAEKESLISDLEPDLTALPSRKRSRLVLVTRVGDTASSNAGSQKPHNSSETVTVRLDLHDSRGRHLTQGGHQVLMWISSADNKSGAAAAALQAVDTRNGSYVASFPVLWRGETRVHAALFFSREVHNAMTRAIVRQQNPYPLVGAFARGKVDQATLCGPFPVIPGFPVTCNLTADNHGLDWFCGAPSKGDLTCRDWWLSRGMGYRAWPHSTQSQADRKVVTAYWKGAFGSVEQLLAFSSHASSPVRPRRSCSKRRPRDTWTDQPPTGFFLGSRWLNLACSVADATAQAQPRDYVCFRHTTFWYTGDSNARAMFELTCALIGAPVRAGFTSKHTIHLPLWCANAALSARMEWHPHSLPFLSGGTWSERAVKLSPRSLMQQRIPDGGRHVILVHLFGHFSYFPSSVYTQHVRDLAAGVRELLRRNPSVKVVVRGPHCWHNPQRADYLATLTSRVLKAEFPGDLRERVVYLDIWGMSVAGTGGVCKGLHPPPHVLKALTDLFLSYVC